MVINPGNHETLIGIDDEVLAELKRRAEPLIDEPNSVLRRELGIGRSDNGNLAETPLLLEEVRRASESPESRSRPSRGPKGKGVKQGRARSTKAKAPRAPKGSLTKEDLFEEPILRALEDAGGQLSVSDVVTKVGKALAGTLNEHDLFEDSNGVPRWEKRVHFVRLKLVDRGLMNKDAPRGSWEISSKGRERLGVGSVK
jgi:hypothetical protein